MDTLGLLPDQSGYNVLDGNSAVAIVLDGGLPRVRADQLGTVSTVSCQWTVSVAQYDYFMAFWRTSTNYGTKPFLIELCGVDSAEFQTYTAWFVPGTFKPSDRNLGITFVISAQLWVVPINNTTGDAALIAAGAPAQ